MDQRIARLLIAILLVLSVPACVKPSGLTPTIQSPSINTPVVQTGELAIASTNAFMDANGVYHVVGEVVNNSSSVLTSISLALEIKDASGVSILKNDDGTIAPSVMVYPMLYTLAPGGASPFEYSYDLSNGTPASFSVTIAGQTIGSANRADLQWENVQLYDDGNGTYYLTGKLVNLSGNWAHIKSLAGGVMGDTNNVLSANLASIYTTELAPAGDANGYDRTPFEITFPFPVGATKWQLYWDADIIELSSDFPLQITITNTYFDQDGSARIFGWISNNSSQTLDGTQVVAGLYASDGTVVDAGNSIVPVPIRAGASIPFGISEFGIVNHNSAQASLVQSCSAQIDPYYITPALMETIDLAAGSETVQKDGSIWTFNGNVINTSGRNLSRITVVAMVLDATNKLVAMDYYSINATGIEIAANEMNEYVLSVYLNPAADATNFITNTLIVGYVK
jgi:hypothetical protein